MTNEGKSAKFLAINHDLINREAEISKVMVHKFTILKCLTPGFATAPYKSKEKMKNKNAKPLSEIVSVNVEGKSIQGMKMFTYPKVGMFDKGPRSEVFWTLTPGNTIKLWLDEERRNDGALIAENIAALSLCEIHVASKTEESVKKGWCFKITSIRVADFSFHSIQKDLRSLCSSVGEAKAKEVGDKSEQPLLEKELETQTAVYFCAVSTGAMLEENEGHVRIISPGEDLPVEVPLETLTAITNCKKVAWACALLEISIAAGAVSLLVVANDFWKSGPKGVPVIDFDALMCWQPPLAAHAATASGTLYRLPFTVDVDGETCLVEMEAGAEAMPVPGAKPPACEDFALTGLDVELASAVPIQFNLVKRSGELHAPAVWKGYYNAGPSRCPVPGTQGKRKWLQTMDEQ